MVGCACFVIQHFAHVCLSCRTIPTSRNVLAIQEGSRPTTVTSTVVDDMAEHIARLTLVEGFIFQ